MATTKTIQPTGETITIPAMTDRPDASVFATDVSRITDAVNSQNQNAVTKGNGDAQTPTLKSLTIVNQGGGSDVITWGGGNDSATSANNAGGILYGHANRKYQFRAKSSDNEHYNDFNLPACNNVAFNATYEILTTRDYPIICQKLSPVNGSVTFTAPNNKTGTFALVFYAGHMSNISHVSDSSTIYSDGFASDFTITKSSHTYTLTRNNGGSFGCFVVWFNT